MLKEREKQRLFFLNIHNNNIINKKFLNNFNKKNIKLLMNKNAHFKAISKTNNMPKITKKMLTDLGIIIHRVIIIDLIMRSQMRLLVLFNSKRPHNLLLITTPKEIKETWLYLILLWLRHQ
jgi:hypothetical protein